MTMLHIGYTRSGIQNTIDAYVLRNSISHTVYISPTNPVVGGTDYVPYHRAIEYIFFYRLLQEIDGNTLLVLDECLQTQNRYDLTYNCIRHYANRTPHVIVFNSLPQIDAADDFMILFDFVTKSRWKRRSFDPLLIAGSTDVSIRCDAPVFTPIEVPTDSKTTTAYNAERDKLFATLGSKDPHTIPRNLYLLTGKVKAKCITRGTTYIARNARLKLSNVYTYDTFVPGNHTIVELPHRFLDMSKFMRENTQNTYPVMVADTNTDRWYFDRYTQWSERINDTITSLR